MKKDNALVFPLLIIFGKFLPYAHNAWP